MTFLRINLKSFFIPIFFASILFVSCQDNKDSTKEVNESVPEATLEQKQQALDNVAPSSSNNSNAASGALNPAHGQPGHRCDIPVGSPLDGSGNSVKATPVQSGQNQVQVAPSSGSGLNPAHGQPGHRCDIKVGDPL